MKDRVRFGIIGTGVIGPWHALAIEACEDAELVAVADVALDKAKALAKEHGDVECYADFRKMVGRSDLDAVSICTPSGLHGEAAIAAAQAGKHVLCEKPLDVTVEKIDAMIDAARENNVKLGGIFQWRTYPVSVRARDAVQSGALGKMVLGDAYLKYYRSQAYYDSAGWRGTWEFDGGGALMNQGVHGIDLLLWIMGDVESVFARTAPLLRKIEVEDTAVAALKFKSGAFGVIEGTTSSNPGEESMLAFHGDKGTIIMTESRFLRWAVAEQSGEHAEEKEDMKQVEGETKTGVSDPTEIGIRGHVIQVADMVKAIKEDRDPMVTGESARKSVQLITAIYESSRTGQEVFIK